MATGLITNARRVPVPGVGLVSWPVAPALPPVPKAQRPPGPVAGWGASSHARAGGPGGDENGAAGWAEVSGAVR